MIADEVDLLDEYCDRLLGYLPIASIRGAIMLMFFNMFSCHLRKVIHRRRYADFGLESRKGDWLVAFLLHDTLNGTEVSQRSRRAAVA